MSRIIASAIAILILMVVSGLTLSVMVTPIYMLLRKFTVVPLKRGKLLQRAIEQGHIVQATCVKTYSDYKSAADGTSLATGETVGIYVYTWNNRQYKRCITCSSYPLKELTLYFIRKPSRATIPNALGIFEGDCSWIESYFAIASIIGLIFGGIGVYILILRW